MRKKPCRTCKHATCVITATGEDMFCMNGDCAFYGEGGCSAEANCEWYSPKHTNVATDLTVRDVYAATALLGVMASLQFGESIGDQQALVDDCFKLADLCMRRRAE